MHIFVWFFWLIGLAILVPRLLPIIGLRRTNFKGNTIPVVLGLYLLFGSGPAVAYLSGRHPEVYDYRALLVVLVGFGLLGFLDDVFGSRQDSGLAGHAR